MRLHVLKGEVWKSLRMKLVQLIDQSIRGINKEEIADRTMKGGYLGKVLLKSIAEQESENYGSIVIPSKVTNTSSQSRQNTYQGGCNYNTNDEIQGKERHSDNILGSGNMRQENNYDKIFSESEESNSRLEDSILEPFAVPIISKQQHLNTFSNGVMSQFQNYKDQWNRDTSSNQKAMSSINPKDPFINIMSSGRTKDHSTNASLLHAVNDLGEQKSQQINSNPNRPNENQHIYLKYQDSLNMMNQIQRDLREPADTNPQQSISNSLLSHNKSPFDSNMMNQIQKDLREPADTNPQQSNSLFSHNKLPFDSNMMNQMMKDLHKPSDTNPQQSISTSLLSHNKSPFDSYRFPNQILNPTQNNSPVSNVLARQPRFLHNELNQRQAYSSNLTTLTQMSPSKDSSFPMLNKIHSIQSTHFNPIGMINPQNYTVKNIIKDEHNVQQGMNQSERRAFYKGQQSILRMAEERVQQSQHNNTQPKQEDPFKFQRRMEQQILSEINYERMVQEDVPVFCINCEEYVKLSEVEIHSQDQCDKIQQRKKEQLLLVNPYKSEIEQHIQNINEKIESIENQIQSRSQIWKNSFISQSAQTILLESYKLRSNQHSPEQIYKSVSIINSARNYISQAPQSTENTHTGVIILFDRLHFLASEKASKLNSLQYNISSEQNQIYQSKQIGDFSSPERYRSQQQQRQSAANFKLKDDLNERQNTNNIFYSSPQQHEVISRMHSERESETLSSVQYSSTTKEFFHPLRISVPTIQNAEDNKKYFFTLALQSKYKLPPNHPASSISIQDLYQLVLDSNIPQSQWSSFIQSKMN